MQAGIVILQEAGGAVFAGKTASMSGEVDAALLGELPHSPRLTAVITDIKADIG